MCYWSPILPPGCGNHYDNVGQHQDKYLLRDTSALQSRAVWHMTPCEHLNINTEPGHDQSHTSEVTWDDKCLSPLSLSTLDRETESSILSDEDNGDDWWRSDQDLDNIDTMIVFSKFITQIKCDGDEDLLRWVTVWQRSPESLSDTFFDLSMTIIVITRGPELWSCLLIGCLIADYPIRCQDLASVTVGGKCQRGRRMGTKCSISLLIAVRSQTNCQASILIKSQKSSWLSFCFGTFIVEMEGAHSGR